MNFDYTSLLLYFILSLIVAQAVTSLIRIFLENPKPFRIKRSDIEVCGQNVKIYAVVKRYWWPTYAYIRMRNENFGKAHWFFPFIDVVVEFEYHCNGRVSDTPYFHDAGVR